MSVITTDDTANPLCDEVGLYPALETGEVPPHIWHIVCEVCGRPGHHDNRSEELAAWGRLKAERDQLVAALTATQGLLAVATAGAEIQYDINRELLDRLRT